MRPTGLPEAVHSGSAKKAKRSKKDHRCLMGGRWEPPLQISIGQPGMHAQNAPPHRLHNVAGQDQANQLARNSTGLPNSVQPSVSLGRFFTSTSLGKCTPELQVFSTILGVNMSPKTHMAARKQDVSCRDLCECFHVGFPEHFPLAPYSRKMVPPLPLRPLDPPPLHRLGRDSNRLWQATRDTRAPPFTGTYCFRVLAQTSRQSNEMSTLSGSRIPSHILSGF